MSFGKKCPECENTIINKKNKINKQFYRMLLSFRSIGTTCEKCQTKLMCGFVGDSANVKNEDFIIITKKEYNEKYSNKSKQIMIKESANAEDINNIEQDCIFTVTTLQPSLFANKRTVGFFNDFEEAKKAVENNDCDISENGYYLYCVIESHDSGIYNYNNLFSWWFKFNRKDNKYYSIEKPQNFKRTISFGLG